MDSDKNSRILIVDDEAQNRMLMSEILANAGYSVDTARDGSEAIDKIGGFRPDIIFLDIMMPGLNGYDVCARLKSDPETSHIPVVLATSLSDLNARIRGLDAGANDFLVKPVDAREVVSRVRNLVRVKEFDDFLLKHNALLQEQVLEKTREIKEFHLETIYRLTLMAEYKDPGTAAHVRRVGKYVGALAKQLGHSEERAELMAFASPMHDIGKIGIPDSILLRPSLLTQQEREIMQHHSIIGWKMLTGSSSEIMKSAATFALTHHERWDGLGYPRGLRGGDIPIEGRILALVDQYDALRSERPYKTAIDHQRSFNIIVCGDGRTMPGHFDPKVLEAFKDMHRTFSDIFDHSREHAALPAEGELPLSALSGADGHA